MTAAQKQQHPDLYRALKQRALRAGESIGTRTVYKGR